MKTQELRQKTTEELVAECRSLRDSLFAKRFQAEIEQVADPGVLAKMRKDVARIRTVLRERGWKGDV